MLGLTDRIHYQIYFFGLILLAAALPTSLFLTSVAEIILAVNWIIEMPPYKRWLIIKKNKSVLVLSGFYIVHVLAMFYTSDWDWGIHDLKIKLPMLFLPVIIGTSYFIDEKLIKSVLNIFISTLLVITLWQLFKFLHNSDPTVTGLGSVHMKVDHIRLSLMLDMALFSMIWLIKNELSIFKWLYIPVGLWFLVVICLLQSATGIIVLFILTGFFLIRLSILSHNIMLRWFISVFVLLAILLTSSYLIKTYSRFSSVQKIDSHSLDSLTQAHHPYNNIFSDSMIENGQYVYLYLCENELREGWSKRSQLSYDGLDFKGNNLKYTLFRYMTSKGLRKDENGLNHLTIKDINAVEAGITNYLLINKYSIYPRIYTLLWELNRYAQTKDANGFSLSQRIEALKTAKCIITKNIWLGVGTGDVCVAFANQYEANHTLLLPENRIRAHNQWVTFVITFGIIGTILIAISLFYPIFHEHKFSSYLFMVIFIVGFLSFFDEDMLETHTPISFFALFYTLFLFAFKDDLKKPIRNAKA